MIVQLASHLLPVAFWALVAWVVVEFVPRERL